MIFLAPLYPAQPPLTSRLMPCAHSLEFGTSCSLCLGYFLLSLISCDAPSCCSDMAFSRNISRSRQHPVLYLPLCLVLVYCNIRFTGAEVLHETKRGAVSILQPGRTEWQWENSDLRLVLTSGASAVLGPQPIDLDCMARCRLSSCVGCAMLV